MTSKDQEVTEMHRPLIMGKNIVQETTMKTCKNWEDLAQLLDIGGVKDVKMWTERPIYTYHYERLLKDCL